MVAKCDLEVMLSRLKDKKDFILVPTGNKTYETITLRSLTLPEFEKIVSNGLLGSDYLIDGSGGGKGGEIGDGSHKLSSKKSRPGRVWNANKK